jgi:DNA-binding response OmpR family regulator
MATRPLLTPSVLLVSNALEEREMYARILRASGYQAIEEATVIAAYRIATTSRIDIVATDVRIGGSVSGLELTRRLRNDARTSTVPIIVLTDVSRPQDGDVAVKAGADTFLEKPVPDNLLKAEILRLLRVPRRLSDARTQSGFWYGTKSSIRDGVDF